LDEDTFLNDCLEVGKQWELQRRIANAESRSMELFKTALRLAKHRELVDGPDQADLAKRRQEIHYATREVLGIGLERDLLRRIERREVLEEDLFLRLLRWLEVDGFDLDQREVALAVLRRPDDAGNRVTGV